MFHQNLFTKSLGGLDIPIITISNNLSNSQLLKSKKIVIIVSRVHPGETNASYLTHGLIQYIVSTDKIANYLRERLVFKIVPMINPDGVVMGNNRTSFLGRDLNRTYERPIQ